MESPPKAKKLCWDEENGKCLLLNTQGSWIYFFSVRDALLINLDEDDKKLMRSFFQENNFRDLNLTPDLIKTHVAQYLIENKSTSDKVLRIPFIIAGNMKLLLEVQYE